METAVELTEWLERFDALVAELDTAPFRTVQKACGRGRDKLHAFEACRLAAETGDDHRRAGRMAASVDDRSAREARATAERARIVGENQQLGADLANGRLSTEQVDLIAKASRSHPAASNDQSLIDAVATAPVDQGARIVRDWEVRKADREKLASEHQRQRSQRRVWHSFNQTRGVHALTLEGDHTTIDELWRLISARERSLWNADGGRDVPVGKHARSRDQRLFDAATELLRGTDKSSGGGRGRGRPSVVFTIPVGNVKPSPRASSGESSDLAAVDSVAHGPVSDAALRDVLERADIAVAVVDAVTLVPLAWGRARRDASLDQYLALVARDQGCVLCGAHWSGCQAHHVMPWNAPAKGHTDLDNLALVCPSDHHRLHDGHRTLVRNTDGTWATRPALLHEIAPSGPARNGYNPKSGNPGPAPPDSHKSGQAEDCANNQHADNQHADSQRSANQGAANQSDGGASDPPQSESHRPAA